MAKVQDFGSPGLSKAMFHIDQSASFILPGLSMVRALGRTIIKNGDVREIELYARLCKRITKETDNLISILVVGYIARNFIENEDVSTKVKAASPDTYQFFEKVNSAVAHYKAKPLSESKSQLVVKKSSWLASMILPGLRDGNSLITEKSLQPSRNMEYSFLEKMHFVLFNSLIFVLLLVTITLLFLSKVFMKRQGLTIVLTAREWCSHVLLTIVLPIVVYQFYKLLPFASMHSSLRENGKLFVIEVLTLTMALIFWSSYRLLRKYSERLENLGVENKPIVNFKNYTLLFSSFSLLIVIVCFSFKEQVLGIFNSLNFSSFFVLVNVVDGTSVRPRIKHSLEYYEYILLAILILIVLWTIIWKRSSIKFSTIHSLLHGMAHQLSFLMLALFIYSSLYLGNMEKYYFNQDSLLVNREQPNVFSTVEHYVVKKLKQQTFGDSNK